MAANANVAPRLWSDLRGVALPGWLRPRAWAYAIPGSRDYRLDLLRGFLVFAMVIDHLGGSSYLTAITGDNQFLVSAAEGFVFISGLLMGIVYGSRVRRLGLKGGIAAVLHRAAVLYITVVTLTLAFVGLYLFTDVPLWMDRNGGLGVEKPLQAVVGTLTLHYTYHGTDILLIYVLLVGAAPLAFYLLATGRTRYLLAGSWLLWGIYQLFPQQAELPWPIANSVSFPLASWQALFYTGLVLGYHRSRLRVLTQTLSRWPVVALLAGATAGLVLLSQAQHAGRLAEPGIPGLDDQTFELLFSKSSLGPGRVVTFFVLAAFALQITTRFWAPISRLFGWVLVPLGQKSLLAYGTHLFLLGPVYELSVGVLYAEPANWVTNSLIQAGLALLVLALVRLETRISGLAGRLAAELQHLGARASRAAGPRQVAR